MAANRDTDPSCEPLRESEKSPLQSRWTVGGVSDGSASYRLASWGQIFDFLEMVVFAQSGHNRKYIWRGQRRSDWSLSSSLDRLFEALGLLRGDPQEIEAASREHLKAFRLAARGRRGGNPQVMSAESDWWALGQHYGLATPLLDWTRSPFAAAYFAFEELAGGTDFRVVYGLDQVAVSRKGAELAEGESLERGRPPIIEFFDPMSDENPRVVSQGGLFTRGPIGTPIERWVSGAFEGSDVPVLLRIEIPDHDRLRCLRGLDRMNINHLSLFPDLSGASRYVNLKRELGL